MKKLLIALVILVVLGLVLVGVTPMLISAGLGKGAIIGAIEENLNAKADYDTLKVTWFSGVTLDDFTVTEGSEQVAKLNLTLDQGLFGLLSGGAIDASVGGTVKLNRDAEGKTTIDRIVKTDPGAKPPAPTSTDPPLAGMPNVSVTFNDLTVETDNVVAGQSLAIRGLNGRVSAARGAPVKADLKGTSAVGAESGPFTLTGEIAQLITAAGELNPFGAQGAMKLSIAAFPVQLDEQAFVLRNAVVDLAAPGLTEKATVTVNGELAPQGAAAGGPGAINGRLELAKLLNDRGQVALTDAASLDGMIELTNVPLEVDGRSIAVSRAAVTINGAPLTEKITLDIMTDARIDGAAPSTLTGSFTIDKPLRPVTMAPADFFAALTDADAKEPVVTAGITSISGTLKGDDAPTALIQPFLAGTPVRLSRDVGATVDIDATIVGGDSPRVTAVVNGAHLDVDLAAAVDPATQRMSGDRLAVSGRLHPELVQELAGVGLDAPRAFALTEGQFTIPAPDASGARPVDEIAFSGVVNLDGTSQVTLPAEDDAALVVLAVGPTRVEVMSPALGRMIQARGSSSVDGAAITFDEVIDGVIGGDPEVPVAARARAAGTLTVTNITPALLAKLAPAQAELLGNALAAPATLTVETSALNESDLAATVRVDAGETLNVDLMGVRTDGVFAAHRVDVTATATPDLVVALQADAEAPVRIADDAVVRVSMAGDPRPVIDLRTNELVLGDAGIPLEIEATSARVMAPGLEGEAVVDAVRAQTTLAMNDAGGLKSPVVVAITQGGVTLTQPPGMTGPVQLAALKGDVSVGLDGATGIAAKGSAALRDPTANASVAALAYDVNVPPGEGAAPTGSVTLSEIDVARLEALTGQPLTGVLGDRGRVEASATASGAVTSITSTLAFPRLSGTVRADIDDTFINATADIPSFTVTKDAATAFLKPADPAADPATVLTVTKDVTIAPTVRAFRAPLALFTGETATVDPASVNIDLALTSSDIAVANGAGMSSTFSKLKATAKTTDLSRGINVAFNVDAGSPGRPAGGVTAEALVRRFLNDEGAIESGRAVMDGTVKATKAPTAVLGAFTTLAGSIEAAIGAEMNLDGRFQGLGPKTGEVEMTFTAPNSTAKVDVYHTGASWFVKPDDSEPLVATLNVTAALREQLLSSIHPVLRDIRSDSPLKVTMPLLLMPTDGNLAGLRSDFTVELGKVQLDRGSLLLAALALAKVDASQKTIPATFQPIVVKIRNGKLTYDRFTLTTADLEMAFQGEVDLVKRTLNLRTEAPLSQLAATIVPREIKALEYTGDPMIPLLFVGSIDKPQVKLADDAVKRILDNAAQKGIQKGLGELFEKLDKDKQGAGDGG